MPVHDVPELTNCPMCHRELPDGPGPRCPRCRYADDPKGEKRAAREAEKRMDREERVAAAAEKRTEEGQAAAAPGPLGPREDPQLGTYEATHRGGRNKTP